MSHGYKVLLNATVNVPSTERKFSKLKLTNI